MGLLNTTRQWARRIKRDVVALWLARSHPATPWYARWLVALVVAYALSPIDLIPDVIPVLGYLDDVLLLPALIWLALRLLPDEVLQASRQQAEQWFAERRARPTSWAGAVAIAGVWLLTAAGVGWWVWQAVGG